MIGRVFPVGAFVHLFRALLEADPLYADLWLEGEIGDLSRSAAGHYYFNLRDEDGCLKCVLFRNQALRLPQLPVAGAQVALHGGLTLYHRSGAVQLSVDLIQPAGLGAAALELEYLRQRLAAEGLFDAARKRPLPAWPRTIGVVTSPHGAAWHDVQSVIGRRFPLASLVLSPAQVQGDGAAESLVAALAALQREAAVDVVIVARGGGGSDDLAAFNDERVVRAVFACSVPVVAGIGHATDRTLAEDAADVSAPTPSAAAELCVPLLDDLSSAVNDLCVRLNGAFSYQRTAAAIAIQEAAQRLQVHGPGARIAAEQTIVTSQAARLRAAMTQTIAARSQAATSQLALLAALDPAAVLARGYAVLEDIASGQPIFSVTQTAPDTTLRAVLDDGALLATVNGPDRAAITNPVSERRSETWLHRWNVQPGALPPSPIPDGRGGPGG
jgi:exodeoxyribonuclease VII large subunit